MDRNLDSEAKRGGGATTALLIMAGIMLGSGLGAAFGNVAIGIPAGMAAGSLAAMIVHALRR